MKTVFAGMVICLIWICSPVHAALNDIALGDIDFDPATTQTIGLSLPVLEGDRNYDARVRVSYRRVGATEWREALPVDPTARAEITSPDACALLTQQ